jgi:hypothetical protein
MYVLLVRDGFTLLVCFGVCDSVWWLTTVGGWACVALEDVGLEFYGWSWRVLRLEQFTGWRQTALVKEKRKKEKVTLMV